MKSRYIALPAPFFSMHIKENLFFYQTTRPNPPTLICGPTTIGHNGHKECKSSITLTPGDCILKYFTTLINSLQTLFRMLLGRMPFSRTAFGRMAFVRMPFVKMPFVKMPFVRMKFLGMTFLRMTFFRMTFLKMPFVRMPF